MVTLKIILQLICVVFLIQGVMVALLKKDDFYAENKSGQTKLNIQKSRWIVLVINVLIWCSAIILIEIVI